MPTAFLALAFAAAAGGINPATLRPLFPEAGEAPQMAGTVVTLTPKGAAPLRLVPVRFRPRPGTSPMGDTHFCGVALSAGGGPPQGVVTLGTGYTDSLICDGLVAAGLAPPTPAGAPRIALIYSTSTLRSTLRTPVVLAFDPAAKRWRVDDATTQAMDDGAPARTVAAVRAKLAKGAP